MVVFSFYSEDRGFVMSGISDEGDERDERDEGLSGFIYSVLNLWFWKHRLGPSGIKMSKEVGCK